MPALALPENTERDLKEPHPEFSSFPSGWTQWPTVVGYLLCTSDAPSVQCIECPCEPPELSQELVTLNRRLLRLRGHQHSAKMC